MSFAIKMVQIISSEIVGTAGYMAPEVISVRIYMTNHHHIHLIP